MEQEETNCTFVASSCSCVAASCPPPPSPSPPPPPSPSPPPPLPLPPPPSYDNPEIALNCGTMLRECIRYEPLARLVLYSEHFIKFFGFVEMSTFDIASDAFSSFRVGVHVCAHACVCMCVCVCACAHMYTCVPDSLSLQELLTRHKVMSSEYLEKSYDPVFERYQKLLVSENYVTRRQSLKVSPKLTSFWVPNSLLATTHLSFLPLFPSSPPPHAAPWRALARQAQLHHDDQVHQQSGEPQAYDEPPQGPQPEHTV